MKTTKTIGQRKVAFVKWCMKHNIPMIKAKMMANKKFGTEYKCASCGTIFNDKDFNRCPSCGE